MKTKNSIALGMLAVTCGLTLTSLAFAQEVSLSSADGSVNMTGQYVDFRDNNYYITTDLGEIRVSADRVVCKGEACPVLAPKEASIVIGGSDTVGLALMPLLLEGYAGAVDAAADIRQINENGDLFAQLIGDQGFGEEIGSISVSSTTSGNGFDQLLAQEIGIGMSSRRIRPEEARALRSDGAGNMIQPAQEHIVAIDSLILITNPANPVKTLTSEQVRQIYTGQIVNWSEVGGQDSAITVVKRPEGSGTRAVFESRVFDGSETDFADNAVIAVTNEDASNIVNEDENALAYVSYAFQRDANPVTVINRCGIAMIPDAFSARTEEYALQRRLYLYTREDTTSEDARAFIDYTTSAEVDDLIGKAGFIGFAVDRRKQALDGPRARALLDPNANAYEGNIMREMLGQMADFDRLSTTFRFRTGSSQLDERGQIDQNRLIDYLERQPAGTEVLMVGFTDTVGEFEGNLSLSRKRAQQVADVVRAAGSDRLENVTIGSRGFGEIAPSGCNDSEEGRRINRRVEVWIKSPA